MAGHAFERMIPSLHGLAPTALSSGAHANSDPKLPWILDSRVIDCALMVRFDDLLAGFEWVSAEPMGNSAYVSRTTGQVHWASEGIEFDDELPADIDDSSIYVGLPSKQDMGLGRALAQQFFREYMPSAYGQVAAFFHRRGAYAKFKELLERNGLLDAWHAHEANEVESALRAWAEEQGILVDA